MEHLPTPILTICLVQATLHMDDDTLPTNFRWRSTCKRFNLIFESEDFKKQIQSSVEEFISRKKDDAKFFGFIFRRSDRFLFRKTVHCLPYTIYSKWTVESPKKDSSLKRALPHLFPPADVPLTTEILRAIERTSGSLEFKTFIMNKLIPYSINLDKNTLDVILQWYPYPTNDYSRPEAFKYQYRDIRNRIVALDAPDLFSKLYHIRKDAKEKVLQKYRFNKHHLPRILQTHFTGLQSLLFVLDHFEKFRHEPHQCCRDYERIAFLNIRQVHTETICGTIIQYAKRLDEALVDKLIFEACRSVKEFILTDPVEKSSCDLSTFLTKMKHFVKMRDCIGILEEAVLEREKKGYYFDHKYHVQLDAVKKYCNVSHLEVDDIQLNYALELTRTIGEDMSTVLIK